MKTYQTLTLIGGIYGIVVVPIILLSILMGLAFFSAFDPDSSLDSGTLGAMTAISLIVSIIISIIALVIVFVMKKPKSVGYILLGLAVIMLVATNISGIIAWVLFFIGGISAIKYKVSDVESKKIINQDILKNRYAKGEITKEEFEAMNKEKLEEKDTSSALDILKQRYSRLEITRDEYEEKKKDLENS